MTHHPPGGPAVESETTLSDEHPLAHVLSGLWRAFDDASREACVALGALVAPSSGPRLAVFDPHLAVGATPLERELPPSVWSVSVLSRAGRVVAVRGERSLDDQWCLDGAIERSPDRVWRFRRGEGASARAWSIGLEGSSVTETAGRVGALAPSKTKVQRDPGAACKWMRRQIVRRIRSGYVPAPSGPPVAWARARYVDGATDFPVDYAVVAITDQQGLDCLRRSPRLRDQVARAAEGPPGRRIFEQGADWCDLVWFPSGRGDGRYSCYWGLARLGEPSSLLVVLGD